MTIRSVVKRGDPRLYYACRLVVDFTAAAIVIRDLRETLALVQSLYQFTRGSGIAASQIGARLAISVVNFEGREYVLCNPHIVAHSDEAAKVSEGCLSFFDVRGNVPRWAWVKVEAQNERGGIYVIETADPDFASLLQHEIDHLRGLLYVDRLPAGTKLTPKPGVPAIP